MSLYLHLETSPGQEMIRHRGKQDDFPACPFSFWAPPPRKKIHFAHESLSDVGRAGAGVWRPVISHSVLLRFHDRTFSVGGKTYGSREAWALCEVLGVRRPQTGILWSRGPGGWHTCVVASCVEVSLQDPSSIYCVGHTYGLCYYKGLFHHQTPLCIPNLKQSLKALTPNSFFNI